MGRDMHRPVLIVRVDQNRSRLLHRRLRCHDLPYQLQHRFLERRLLGRALVCGGLLYRRLLLRRGLLLRRDFLLRGHGSAPLPGDIEAYHAAGRVAVPGSQTTYAERRRAADAALLADIRNPISGAGRRLALSDLIERDVAGGWHGRHHEGMRGLIGGVVAEITWSDDQDADRVTAGGGFSTVHAQRVAAVLHLTQRVHHHRLLGEVYVRERGLVLLAFVHHVPDLLERSLVVILLLHLFLQTAVGAGHEDRDAGIRRGGGGTAAARENHGQSREDD